MHTTSSIERMNAAQAAGVGAKFAFTIWWYSSSGRTRIKSNKNVNELWRPIFFYEFQFIFSFHLPMICCNDAPVLVNRLMILVTAARFVVWLLVEVVSNIIAIFACCWWYTRFYRKKSPVNVSDKENTLHRILGLSNGMVEFCVEWI